MCSKQACEDLALTVAHKAPIDKILTEQTLNSGCSYLIKAVPGRNSHQIACLSKCPFDLFCFDEKFES